MPLFKDIYLIAEQRAREHLIDFSILANPNYLPSWHHEVIAEELEHIAHNGDQNYKILCLFVPPRHGKSQLATINFPAWYLGRSPDKEIIVACYSADLALDFGSKTRDLVNSEVYQSIFNRKVELKIDEQSKAKWQTKMGGTYFSVGIGGALTGRGANILIIDDPIKNSEEAQSSLIRDKHWDWFKSTAYTRLEPNGVIILIMTRWHYDDLAGRILANQDLKKLCKVINFPAFAIIDDEHRKVGDPLWPERYPAEVLNQIKNTLGPYEWSALYQQSPILTENQEFKLEWFKYRDRAEIERLNTRNYLTIDTAMSDKSSADYTGFCENYVDRENKWSLAAYHLRLNPKDLVDYIFTLHAKRNFEKIGIEKTAYTIGLKPFIDDEMRKRNTFLPIVELSHKQTNKDVRIRGLIPRYSSLSVFHIRGECDDLENELLSFPRSTNDDIMDATAYQLQIVDQNQINDFQKMIEQNETEFILNPYK